MIKVKLLTSTAKVPTRGSEYAAGYDLYANETIDLPPMMISKVHTGINMSFPPNLMAKIESRSGLVARNSLFTVGGIIDSDFRGEYIVLIYNVSDKVYTLNSGERVAQLIFYHIELPSIEIVTELDDTERGTGGFGSTGK